MTKKYLKDYLLFLETWGEDAQIMMAIEEMSELTKELCKYLRYKHWHEDKLQGVKDNIEEETADVLNCVEQLELIFNGKNIQKIREEKMQRTLKKVKKNG